MANQTITTLEMEVEHGEQRGDGKMREARIREKQTDKAGGGGIEHG